MGVGEQDQFLLGEQIGEAAQSSSYSPRDGLITGASPASPERL